jgi:heme exporter protein B
LSLSARRSPSWAAAVWAVLRKDLTIELRTREALVAVGVFGLLVAVIFSFAFDPAARDLRPIFGGILWVGFLFAGLLGMGRTFARERENDAIVGALAAPVDPTALFYGKALANLVLLLLAEVFLLPAFLAMMNVVPAGPLLPLIGSIALGTAGLVAVGTTVSALATRARAGEVLLPLLALPLLSPLLLAAVRLGEALVAGTPAPGGEPWFLLLAAYDGIFWFLPLGVFEYLLEA